jgi:predicted dehydrogenase
MQESLPPVRWGILGAGNIAKKFADGLKSVAGAELIAVGSRSQEKADAFAQPYGIAHRHASYEALVADADVDAIYVATPHPMHAPHSILALQAGKAVLCEKPFTANAAQAEQIVAAARKAKRFCMEAMWSRFLPPVQRVKKLLGEGAIGEVRMVMADFGFRCGWNPASRLLDPALAGGGLLDVGVYVISLAGFLLGRCRDVVGLAEVGQTGVDEQAGMVLRYDGGKLAVLATGVRTNTPHEAWVLGADGRIHMHAGWWRGSHITVSRGKEVQEIDEPMVGNGYNYQAEQVARCLAAGKLESDTMPLEESVAIMKTADELRKQFGVKYPFE